MATRDQQIEIAKIKEIQTMTLIKQRADILAEQHLRLSLKNLMESKAQDEEGRSWAASSFLQYAIEVTAEQVGREPVSGWLALFHKWSKADAKAEMEQTRKKRKRKRG